MIANENDLKDALRRLAASMPREAPACVEQRLLEQFRRRRQVRRRIIWASAASVGTAIAAGIFTVFFMIPATPGPPAPVTVHAAPPPIVLQVAPVVVARRSARKQAPPLAQPSRAPEIATTFYPLPDADSLPPADHATVMRVRLPRSAMRMVGLPVNEERVNERIQADVVLGQDGLVRAVRFLQ